MSEGIRILRLTAVMQDSLQEKIKAIASRCESNDVFIIGKGPSADGVECDALPPGFIINLNDSERIRAGDVGIFSANWVRQSLEEEGFRCGFYLAGKPLPRSVSHEVLPSIPPELDHHELNILRIERREFFDESFVLLNAFKIAMRISELKEKPINVYLIGFDFSTIGGSLSKKVGVDNSGAPADERNAIISGQEHDFRQCLAYFRAGKILNIAHVGNKDYSTLTISEFNREVVGAGNLYNKNVINLLNPDRVIVVAEVTNNHLGDPARLVEMVERSKDAGADLIKVQKRDVDRFYTKEQLDSYYWSPFGTTLGDYRRGVELNEEGLQILDDACKANEIEWFSTVLDLESYNVLTRYNPRMLKIPSTISGHRNFHRDLAKVYRGALVVSTGFTDQEYVNYVLETFSENEVVYLLHCISAYPTPQNACNVAVVRAYHKLHQQSSKIIPGYSSHDLGSTASMLAIASGARMIEKHVKLGNVDWIHFDKVAIDLKTNDFKRFIDDVRVAEEITGSEVKTILECEHHKYAVK
jgi:sialic acid synthase SpsE